MNRKYHAEWNEYTSNLTSNSVQYNFAALEQVTQIVQPKMNVFDHLNKVKIARILGLMALICYMIVILFTWFFANIEGYVYFSAGEPVPSIKYIEWVPGLLGIFVAVNYLQKELNEYNI